MKRHPTDAISLAAGIFFVSLAVMFVLEKLDSVHLDVRFVPAILCTTLGLAGVIGGLAASRRRSPQDQPTG
jgi:hypothetical protein